jgi:hypothetical protein
MLAQDQLDLLSASLRHQQDAESYLAISPDQSWHLAPFALECARKACLSNNVYRKALGHEDRGTDDLMELVLAVDARALRLPLQGWLRAVPDLQTWKPDHRYDRTGAHVTRAAALVNGVTSLHQQVLARLFLVDGYDPEQL